MLHLPGRQSNAAKLANFPEKTCLLCLPGNIIPRHLGFLQPAITPTSWTWPATFLTESGRTVLSQISETCSRRPGYRALCPDPESAPDVFTLSGRVAGVLMTGRGAGGSYYDRTVGLLHAGERGVPSFTELSGLEQEPWRD